MCFVMLARNPFRGVDTGEEGKAGEDRFWILQEEIIVLQADDSYFYLLRILPT